MDFLFDCGDVGSKGYVKMHLNADYNINMCLHLAPEGWGVD